ncbi:uncharacterized protein LOC129732739 [Wyeomyia smithii]|uniref:uncharacterized protein LOC129732739 n=1 Tax=Wyeomyia smithii TaxID=174621 RepID=UPI0024681BEB|nr:uncharacterized protein LOC129732739 [Wyeomyia smithii]
MYDEKRRDREESNINSCVRVASFDLQKCLPTPFLRCGQAFYRRQLYTLNLSVFESYNGKNEAYCYLWNESIARRGAQEIGSCILYDVQRVLNSTPSNKTQTEPLKLIYYSDRCSGQNHNFIMCMMFLNIIDQCQREGREATIIHKFMISGHSHMEVDSIHAAIERSKKRSTIDIETPRDWALFISQVRRKIPINVVELDQTKFLALKNLNIRFNRPKYNTDGPVIKLRDIIWFEYRTTAPGRVFYKQNVEDDYSCFIAINEAPHSEPYYLTPLNLEPIPLSQEKLEDLRNLLPFVSNKQYYEVMLKNLVVKKRGRKKLSKCDDHFEDDMDRLEEEYIK